MAMAFDHAMVRRRMPVGFVVLLLVAAAAVGVADERDTTLSEFKRFDTDDSGYLSKAEMEACRCAMFDRNGDQILMPAEYAEGRRAASAPPAPSAPKRPLQRTKGEFDRCDTDASGYLSRAEARACNCESLDSNGDLIIMPAEFVASPPRGSDSTPKPGRDASPTPAPVTSTSPNGAASSPPQRSPSGGPPRTNRPKPPGSLRVGDRVKAGCYGNMKEGVIERIEGDRAWVRFADEPNCDAFRDITALQPLAKAGGKAPGGQGAAGGAPPSGTYVCQKISGSSLIGLGDLEIKGDKYSGIGGGSFAPFTLNGAGDITWTKGIRGLPDGWTVTSSHFAGLDYRGRPLIKIGYKTSRGSTDLIDCVRE